MRIALITALVGGPLMVAGWLWLRDSSLVSVQRVQIEGVHGPDATAIDVALTDAARGMTTLDLRAGALRAAVARFSVVRSVQASPSLPHGLRIVVNEQLPVAALDVGGARTAVAADGVVLGPALLSSGLPTLASATPILTGQRVSAAALRGTLVVLGAAPAPMLRAVEHVFSGPDGLTVLMRNGLRAYFGDASRPHAKWMALARVLADASSTGAVYVDVRMPERPAAGFPAGVSPAFTSTSATTSSSLGQATPEGTAAALVAGLAAALPSQSPTGSQAPTSTSASEQASATASAQAATAAPGEGGAGTEVPSSTGAQAPTTSAASGG